MKPQFQASGHTAFSLASFAMMLISAAACAATGENRLVSELGRSEAIVMEGNETFTASQILNSIAYHMDYRLAAHPAGPLDAYLALLSRKITLGYKRAGFPEAKVSAAIDLNPDRVLVRVAEGRRYRCGDVLLTGVPSMTNQIIRQKISDMLAGFEFGVAQTNLARIGWRTGQPAPLDDSAKDALTRLVLKTLEDLDYFQAKVAVSILPDSGRHLADLTVNITDEGIKGTIEKIEVGGLRANTREKVLDYLKLKPGMELHGNLINTISNQLWASARFEHQDVLLRRLPEVGKFELFLDLAEMQSVPPLDQPFAPREQALLKFRDWVMDWRNRPEDLVCSLTATTARLRIKANVIISDAGFVVVARPDGAPEDTVGYAIVVAREHVGFYSPGRQRKFTYGDSEIGATVSIRFDPRNISFLGGITHKKANTPIGVDFQLAPAAALRFVQNVAEHVSIQGGILTAAKTNLEDNYRLELKVDTDTGRLVQFLFAAEEGAIQAHFEPGAFAKALGRVAAASAHHSNDYAPNRRIGPWLAFMAAELIESPYTEPFLESFLHAYAPEDKLTNALQAASNIKPFLAQLREWSRGRDLSVLFDPLSRLQLANEESDSDDPFFVPMDDVDNTANPMMQLASAAVIGWSDVLFARGSWPWTLLREAAFNVAGKGKYTGPELEKLLESDQTGPIACLATASLLGKVNPKSARTFAERGLSSLIASNMHKDMLILLNANSALTQILLNLLATLRTISDQQINALVANLRAQDTQFILELARVVRAANPPDADAIQPVVEKHWEAVPRHYLMLALNQFLPQVQFLTNSQALFERGLAVGSGTGPMQDLEESAQCFRKAAEQGHAGAQLHLGLLYESGSGVPQNFDEAMRWYRKSFARNEPHAACRIGDLYRDGKGVSKDIDEAARLYRIDAVRACMDAQYKLGLILENQNSMTEAMMWLRIAAELGQTAAQIHLGELLGDGLFVTADHVEACQWLLLAVEQDKNKLTEIMLRQVKAKLSRQQLEQAQKRANAIEERLKNKRKAASE